jgi:hypothetical protein
VDNLAIILEHVDLVNTRDGLNVQLLERSGKLTVITTTGLGRSLLDLTAGSTYFFLYK